MLDIRSFAILAAAVLGASSVAAQERTMPPLTGAQAMHALRESGSVGPAQRTLQQVDGPVSRVVQDDLADSLVAFVLSAARTPLSNRSIRGPVDGIINSLGLSGMKGTGGPNSKPYVGAGERLLRIAHAVDLSRAAGIVYYISALADQEQARTHLSAFATSTHPAAYAAVEHLERMPPDGVKMLRSLWERGAVTEPRAKESLDAIAGHLRWFARPSSPPTRRPLGGV